MTYTKDSIEFLPVPPHTHFEILTGRQFTRWTVLGLAQYVKSRPRWWCECECGTIKHVAGDSLIFHRTQSCGCLTREKTIERKTIYTKTDQPFSKKLKSTWNSMRGRCKSDSNYIGRIKVCDRWQYSFDNFITDMGEPPTRKHTIERRDNDKDYEPSNCYWALQIVQMNNTRANRFLTLHDKTETIAQWCRDLNLNRAAIGARVSKGWSDEAVLCTPMKYSRSLRR